MAHEPHLSYRPPTFDERVADLGWSVVTKVAGALALLAVGALFSSSGGFEALGELLSSEPEHRAVTRHYPDYTGPRYVPDYPERGAGRGARSYRYQRRTIRCPRWCDCRSRPYYYYRPRYSRR